MTPQAKSILLTVTLPNFVVAVGFLSWVLWTRMHHQPFSRLGVGLGALALTAGLYGYTAWAILRIKRQHVTTLGAGGSALAER